jgi:hypothetical protein
MLRFLFAVADNFEKRDLQFEVYQLSGSFMEPHVETLVKSGRAAPPSPMVEGNAS